MLLFISLRIISISIMSKFGYCLLSNSVQTRLTKTFATAIKTTSNIQRGTGTRALSSKNDFRQVGKANKLGALDELLRRVMEIDADITKIPFKNDEYLSNTQQQCTAYCISDFIDIQKISESCQRVNNLSIEAEYESMLRIIDKERGGDIYTFDNGTIVIWGSSESSERLQVDLLSECLALKKEPKTLILPDGHRTSTSLRFAVDEDEATDFKGDIILLNPYTPSIDSSKTAFSYALGRLAKLTSFERNMKQIESKWSFISRQHSDIFLHDREKRQMIFDYLRLRERMLKAASDGFLETREFQWAEPSLSEYVNKVSAYFNVESRISILNKKLDYFKDIITLTKGISDC